MSKEKKKKKNGFNYFLLIILLLIILLFVYARFVGTTGLVVKEYSIINQKIPTSFQGFKIVHFSDIHYGTTINQKELENIVKKINDLKPDIIVFTGDLFDNSVSLDEKKLNIIRDSLSSLNASIYKLCIKGEDDYKNNTFDSIMNAAGFTILENSGELIYYNDLEPIWIGGVPSSIEGDINYEETFKYFKVLDNTKINANYKVLLMHEPDNISKVSDYKVDLALAGHSHNGQVTIPFVGALFTPEKSKVYYNNYYKVNNTDFYISSGLGTTKYGIRLFNRPSINLYRLYHN